MKSKKPFSDLTRLSSDQVYRHAALVSALTRYDQREEAKAQKNRRHYHNPYALGHFFGALERAEAAVNEGATLRAALLEHFNGRLLDVVLRAIGEPKATPEEIADQDRISRAMVR